MGSHQINIKTRLYSLINSTYVIAEKIKLSVFKSFDIKIKMWVIEIVYFPLLGGVLYI